MDEGAFSRAIVGDRSFLVNWIRAKFRLSKDDAEDFVQQTLLVAWAHRGTYDDQQKMRPWLMVILVNLVLSHKRRAWRIQFKDDMGPFDTPVQGNQFDALYLKKVIAKMVELPLDQIDAIVLVARGEEYEEAADIMQGPSGTVKSRVARGRRALRALVE